MRRTYFRIYAIVGSMTEYKAGFMHTDNDGKLTNVAKARGRNAAITAFV